jgi:hypothetical protein
MTASLKHAAFSSFRMLVRPIVSLMLRCGVTWKELSDVLRLVYVSVATDEYGKHGRPANVSRVAILTDMSRRDVRRARDLLDQESDTALTSLQRISRATRVLSGWYQDADFLDSKGKPKLLDISGPKGFEGLLKRYAPDIPPTAMLKELMQVGAVRETPSGRVRAVARTFVPSALNPAAVIRAGEVVGDLTRTIIHNVAATGKRTKFERRAMSRQVVRVSRRAFDSYLEEKGMTFLEDIDGWLTDHETEDPDKPTIRLGVGVYLITED